jgi:hypothetical protein
MPYFAGLRVGADGRVWVPLLGENVRRGGSVSMRGGTGRATVSNAQRPGNTNAEEPRPALYDVFEPNGTYLGQVQIPARVSTIYRRGDHVWGVAYNEDDVATVKRYRIAWR